MFCAFLMHVNYKIDHCYFKLYFIVNMSQDLLLTVFQSANPYLMGQRLDNVVAKKSVPHFPEEDEVETATSNIKTWTSCCSLICIMKMTYSITVEIILKYVQNSIHLIINTAGNGDCKPIFSWQSLLLILIKLKMMYKFMCTFCNVFLLLRFINFQNHNTHPYVLWRDSPSRGNGTSPKCCKCS